jgi:hypothetical protein
MAKNHDSPKEVELRIDARSKGAATKLGAASLQILGVSYDSVSLPAKLQSLRVPYSSTNDADEVASAARKVRDAAQPGTLEFLDALDAAVEGQYGSSSDVLEAFGISRRKPRRVLTPEEKLAQAQKSRATRAKLRAARAQAQADALQSVTPPPPPPPPAKA